MAITNLNYGAETQINIDLDGLLDAAYRQSDNIDNGANGFTEIWVGGIIDGGSAGSVSGYINVYAAISADDEGVYSGGATGVDGAYTDASGSHAGNLIFVRRIICRSDSAYNHEFCFPLSPAFNGVIPEDFSLIFENRTGATLGTTTGAGNEVHYKGVTLETV